MWLGGHLINYFLLYDENILFAYTLASRQKIQSVLPSGCPTTEKQLVLVSGWAKFILNNMLGNVQDFWSKQTSHFHLFYIYRAFLLRAVSPTRGYWIQLFPKNEGKYISSYKLNIYFLHFKKIHYTVNLIDRCKFCYINLSLKIALKFSLVKKSDLSPLVWKATVTYESIWKIELMKA